jgi:RimJ/RimL family protein N-acetyltransferase
LPPPDIIETPRLHLRKPLLEDAAAVFDAYGQDPDVTKYLCWRPHKSIDDALTAMLNRLSAWERHTDYSWVITPNGQPATILGMISATPERHAWRYILGYVLGREYWKKGIMTEAVKGVVRTLFQDPDVFRVWAVVDLENVASARVLEKSGMRCEGILRRWSLHPNISEIPRDCWSYAIVR